MRKSIESRIAAPTVPAHLAESQRTEVLLKAYDGIFKPSYRLPPFNPDALIQQRGYDTMESMLTMAACRSAFDLKRYAVLADGWTIEPFTPMEGTPADSEAQTLAELLTAALSDIRNPATDISTDFRAVVFESMMGAWMGNRCAEIQWREIDEGPLSGKLGFQGFWSKPNKQIGFDIDERTLEVLNFVSFTPNGSYEFQIPGEKLLYYVHNQSHQSPFGNGDSRACFKHYFYMDGLMKVWAMALERWGAPVFVVKYPASLQGAAATAQKTLDGIRQGSAPAIPDSWEYELVAAPQGVFEAFESGMDWHTRQIALNIHGNTLSTGEGKHGSTSAGADVHQDAGELVYDHLARNVEAAFNQQVIRRFVRYNFGASALAKAPSLRLRQSKPGDISLIAQALSTLNAMGNLPSRSKTIRQMMGMPPLDADEEKMLDTEKQAEQEAQQQLADARNSNKVAKMSDFEYETAKGRLVTALMAKARLEAERAA